MIRKILSKTTYISVIIMASYLLVANILHITYLKQYDSYNFNGDLMIKIKENLTTLENKVTMIDNLDTSVYSESDLSQIKNTMRNGLIVLKQNKLLTYHGNVKFHLKDLFNLYSTQSISVSDNISILKILEKYDTRINSYLTLYKNNWVANAYAKEEGYIKLFDSYKYTTSNLLNANIIAPNQYKILTLIYDYNASISLLNYHADLILGIGGVNNE